MNVKRVDCTECNGTGIALAVERRPCVVRDEDRRHERNRCTDDSMNCRTCRGNGWVLEVGQGVKESGA